MTRLAVAAAIAALALGGCGGDDEADDTGPAAVVPADTLIYAEAVLRPEGEARTAIETPLTALLDTEDPGGMIVEQFDRLLAEEDDLSYSADIEPWLGERGAIFFASVYPPDAGEGDVAETAFDDADGAFVVETTDPDASVAFAKKIAEEGDAHEVVGDFLVAGSEEGVEAVVETEAGGESLADDPDFESELGEDADATASLFVDVPAIVAAADEAGELSNSDREALDTVFAGIADAPLAAALEAQTTGFGLEVSYGATELPFLSAAEESALLRDLPGDSWFAAGFSDAGEAIGSFVESADDFGIAAEELEATREEFLREYGLDLEDAFEPLGDGAFFANGQGIFGAGGGVVFETDDPAAAKDLVAGLERAAKRGGEEVRSLSGAGGESGFSITVEGAPGTVNFVAGGDRIVVAYGQAATTAVLDPAQPEGTLGESEGFAAAEAALGGEYDVTGYFDFSPLVELLDLAAAADPALQAALPYLESLDFLITGSNSDGERERQRLFLGISGITVEPTT